MSSIKITIKVILIIFTSFFLFNFVQAETENRFSNSDFELLWSSEYQAKTINDPRVVVFLKHKQKDFPTINIIKIPGLYNFNRDTAKHLEELNTSYQLAGIQVKTSHVLDSKINSGNFHAQVFYFSKQQEFIADVVIFNGVNEHYILTLITPSKYEERETQAKELLKNLTIRHEISTISEDSRNVWFYWIIIAIGVLLVVLAFGKLVDRRL